MPKLRVGANWESRGRVVVLDDLESDAFYLVSMVVVRNPFGRYPIDEYTRIVVEKYLRRTDSLGDEDLTFNEFEGKATYVGTDLNLETFSATWSGGEDEDEWVALACLAVVSFWQSQEGAEKAKPPRLSRYKREPVI